MILSMKLISTTFLMSWFRCNLAMIWMKFIFLACIPKLYGSNMSFGVLRELNLSPNPTIYYSPSFTDSYAQSIMCDLVAATDIASKGLNWECIDNQPVNYICEYWGGVICYNGVIQEIHLQYYSIIGTIPTSIGGLTSLLFLQIEGNALTGTIPSSLGELSLLSDLWLGSNKLMGSVPSSLGNIESLQVLSLTRNCLTGTIPTSLEHLYFLRVLWLGYNKLTGTIPSGLNSLSSLYTVYINNNSLTGTIPSTIGYVSRLVAFSAYGNSLIGSIPSSFVDLRMLTSFRIYGNNLSGSLPSVLCGHNLVDFYPRLFPSDDSPMSNARLTCYAPCLSSIAFHYYGSLPICKSASVIPNVTYPTSYPSYVPTSLPTSTPAVPQEEPSYFLMMISILFVIFDVAILSMLILECSGLGQL